MIIAVGFLFIVLMSAPLLRGVFHYRKNEGEILEINQDKIKDPRYFGKSFAGLIEKNIHDIDGRTIKLSQEEEFINPSLDDVQEQVINQLVIACEDFVGFENTTTYKKEIYGAQNIVLNHTNELLIRAAYSKKNMVIGSNTQVIRWLDAEGTLAIHDHCHLGISASSATRMSIGENCHFHRLYSPEIQLGQYAEDEFEATDGKNPLIYRLPVQRDRTIMIRQLADKHIDDDGVVNFTLFSWKDIYIPENIIVQGDIRSDKNVDLRDGAAVCGNVFAEGDIHLGKNVCVLGNVFSQGEIYMDEGAVVGQRGRIVSVIARKKIVAEKRVFVFGFMSCEKEGVIAANKFSEKIETSRESVFLKEPERLTHLTFESLEEYQTLKNQNYRYHSSLEKVTIPDAATTIPKSMFYHCEALRAVDLPKNLADIGAYSFTGCSSLKNINLDQCVNLKEIGHSAFEFCKSLDAITIPAAVETIGVAAFSDCQNLQKVSFHENSKLKMLGDHCFNGCENLKEVHLGLHVEKIGISAFKNCFALEKIVLPETCKDEPGILELPINLLEFYPIDLKETSYKDVIK